LLLTNGWDHHARGRAATKFELEVAELEDLHYLTFETYEEGRLALGEYFGRVVFYQERAFTRAQFRRFMFAQSKSYPEMTPLRCQRGRSSISKTPRCLSRSPKVWGFAAFCTRTTGQRVPNRHRSGCRMTKKQEMKPAESRVVTITGGSLSINFALFAAGEPLRRILAGELERIGTPQAALQVKGWNPTDDFSRPMTAADHTAAVGIGERTKDGIAAARARGKLPSVGPSTPSKSPPR
jgi:hypothetical protein